MVFIFPKKMAMFSTFLYFSSVAVIHVLINIETLPINSTSCFLSLPSVAGFMSLNMEQHPGFLLLNMEQQVEDATMDKAVKEIDDVEFEASNGGHKDISSSFEDSQQASICESFYELAKVSKFKRLDKRANALKTWKWDEVIQIDSETEDEEEDVTPVIKRAKHAFVVESKVVG
ncbi:hypothetical protein HanRHA438_Chr00c11g0848651 [Helianthus annuus]|nr:hypothetical protein HanRHA438_Chr00c11g0848651 [Helianthus annuus]